MNSIVQSSNASSMSGLASNLNQNSSPKSNINNFHFKNEAVDDASSTQSFESIMPLASQSSIAVQNSMQTLSPQSSISASSLY